MTPMALENTLSRQKQVGEYAPKYIGWMMCFILTALSLYTQFIIIYIASVVAAC